MSQQQNKSNQPSNMSTKATQSSSKLMEGLGKAPIISAPQHLVNEETRQYWFHFAEQHGVDQAITAIHNEIGRKEPRVFDGGFEKSRFETVQSLRLMARELWNIRLRQQTAKTYGDQAASKAFGKIAKS